MAAGKNWKDIKEINKFVQNSAERKKKQDEEHKKLEKKQFIDIAIDNKKCLEKISKQEKKDYIRIVSLLLLIPIIGVIGYSIYNLAAYFRSSDEKAWIIPEVHDEDYGRAGDFVNFVLRTAKKEKNADLCYKHEIPNNWKIKGDEIIQELLLNPNIQVKKITLDEKKKGTQALLIAECGNSAMTAVFYLILDEDKFYILKIDKK